MPTENIEKETHMCQERIKCISYEWYTFIKLLNSKHKLVLLPDIPEYVSSPNAHTDTFGQHK